MRTGTLLVLVLALVSGGIAGYAALQVVRQRAPVAETAEPRTSQQVVVAARDLAVGALLGEEDVRTVEWPGNAVPAGFATSIPDVVGRGLITSVRLNEPLLEGKMSDRNGQGGLPIVIPEGMRAITVPVNEVVGVAGFVGTRTRVDVVLIITPPGGSEMVSKTILQNVEVLAVAQNYQPNPEGEPTVVSVVTLLLSLEDSERLILATAQGRIQLALRNMIDVQTVRTAGVRTSGLLTGAVGGYAGGSSGPRRAAVPAPTAEETGTTVELFKGGKRALIRF
jgi:pilus assembly protein CpaB